VERGGAPALMTAVLVSTIVALLLLSLRFRSVTRRAVRRA
jgi:hypothetical protein